MFHWSPTPASLQLAPAAARNGDISVFGVTSAAPIAFGVVRLSCTTPPNAELAPRTHSARTETNPPELLGWSEAFPSNVAARAPQALRSSHSSRNVGRTGVGIVRHVRGLAGLVVLTLVAGGFVTFGLAGAAYASVPPSITTTQLPASATVGTSVADKATVMGLVDPSAGDTVTFNLYSSSTVQNAGTLLSTDTETVTLSGFEFACPPADEAGFPLGDTDYTTDPFFCSYPAFPGENPNDFYCTYSATTGALVTDNDAGFCPATAVNRAAARDSTGTATSSGFTTTATGTDYWVATFNGDTNNSAVSSGAADEPVSITGASPSITTTQQPASQTVGGSIADKARLSGGVSPTGTVTFNLYDNSAGTGTPLFTDADEPLSSGSATSSGFTTTATGTDYWVATYNGDTNNNAVSSGAAAEPVSITAASASITTTQQPASQTVGGSIADKAGLSGGDSPTGTVTFNLYDNSAGTGTPLFTDADVPLSSGSATSSGFTTTATGTDYWVATYNGDANNNAVSSGAADEPVSITGASPSITTTQQPASQTVGGSIADKAGLSGGDSPTGTVTFNLYDNRRDGHPVVHGCRRTAFERECHLVRVHDDGHRDRLLGRDLQRRHQQQRGEQRAAAEPVSITPASQHITFPALRNRSIVESPFALVGVTGGGSGQPVTFTASGGKCTVSGTTVKLVKTGTCTITPIRPATPTTRPRRTCHGPSRSAPHRR